LLLGTNLTNSVLVNRGIADISFYPIASQKASAPILFVPSTGIQNLYLWQGTGVSKIKTIVLFKTDSLAPLILNDPSTTVTSYNRFTTKHTFPKPGVSLVNLFWRNSKDINQFLDISGSVPFASVERGAINASHPSGLVCFFNISGGIFNETISFSIFTNISFTQYNGVVLFYCGIGIQRFLANQTNSNFQCQITSLVEGNNLVSLYVRHSISNEELKVSTNDASITIYSKINKFNLTTELVDIQNFSPFANNDSMKNQIITFALGTQFNADIANVYCKQFTKSEGVLLYKANLISLFTLVCEIKNPIITQLNMDDSLISLWVNSSTIAGGESGFYITTSNITHLVIREPVTLSLPQVSFIHLLPTQFSVNISTISPIYSPMINNIYPSCTNISNCTFALETVGGNPPFLPIYGNLQLALTYGSQSKIFLSPRIYLSGNITMTQSSPFPFIMHPFKTKTSIKFDGIQGFNPLFDFYCLDKRSMTKIRATILDMNVFCEIESNFKNEKFNVEIYVNSTIQELNTRISESNIELTFDSLQISPSYIEKTQTTVFEILSNDTSKYIIPNRYRESLNNFKLITMINSQEHICNGTAVNTTCTSNSVIADDGLFSVYLMYFKFVQDSYELMNLTKPILVYRSFTFDTFPHALKYGDSSFIILNFFGNTFNVNSQVGNVEYYCHVNETKKYYNATRLSQNQLNCSIPSLSYDQISLSAYIRVPSVSNDYLLVSQSPRPLYYIRPKLINFKDPIQPLFYTSQVTQMISLVINTEVEFSLVNFMRCSLNTTLPFTQTTTYLSSNGTNSHYLNCTFNVATPGRYGVIIQYVEGNTIFSLNSNSVELLFTGKFVMSSFLPSVGITNVTNHVKMTTSFPSKDYGTNVKFVTKYGFLNDIYHNQTKETNVTVVGDEFQFNSDFQIQDPATYFISVWMDFFGKQLEVISPVSYKFIGN
jgi:hypothetical protein